MSKTFVKNIVLPGKPHGLFLLLNITSKGEYTPLNLPEHTVDEDTTVFLARVTEVILDEGLL